MKLERAREAASHRLWYLPHDLLSKMLHLKMHENTFVLAGACSLGGRDLSPALRVTIPDVQLPGQLFDLLLLGYFNTKLSLYCAMEDLSTGHQLIFNKCQKEFIAASLYLR